MGPPEAEPVLREALAAGIDEGVLVSDPSLAGSDALVTARVLARAVRRSGAEVVLAGDRAADAETGLVGGAVAERLGVPFAGPARRILRDPEGPGLELDVDTPGGHARWRANAPIVLGIGEKIAKPPRPTDDARSRASALPIARWTPKDLGLDEGQVGEAGSPTIVAGVASDAPTRRRRRYADGPIAERVSRAFAELGDVPDPPSVVPTPRPRPAVTPGGPSGWVLVTDPEGRPDDEAMALVRVLSAAGLRTSAIVVGPSPGGPVLRRLAAAGASEALHLASGTGPLDPAAVAGVLAAASTALGPPATALFVSDAFGREVAARWSARHELGTVADAAGFSIGDDGAIAAWSKPAFGGARTATIRARGRTVLATVRPGAMDAPGPTHVPDVIPVRTGPSVLRLDGDPRREAVVDESVGWYGDLAHARRVVTVGMGVGGPEGIERLRPHLARWNAALGATRRVVDAGWVPARYQVGLTGRSVAPPLAVLLGVGKAVLHVAGLRRAGRLVAVNPDPAAPVFEHVDAGILGGWEEALPALDAVLGAGRPA